ncbi:MAG: endopeptidase La [Verrucomicrobiota bacterium]
MASISEDHLKASLQPPQSPGEGNADSEPTDMGEELPHELPVIPLDGVVLFPYTMTSLTLAKPEEIELTEEVAAGDRLVAFVPLKSGVQEADGPESFFEYGCVGRITKMLRFPDDTVRVLVRGLHRVELLSVSRYGERYEAFVRIVEEAEPDNLQVEALSRKVRDQFEEIIGLSPNLPEDLRIALFNIDDRGRMADLIADTISLGYEEKLSVLAALNVEERLGVIMTFMTREVNVLRLGHEIQSQVNNAFEEQQREHFLREQLRAIQEQLGEDTDSPDVADLRQKVADAGLPEATRDAAERELAKLNRMHPAAPEHNVARTYVEWLVDMPWNQCSEDQLDLKRARRILNRDHYDLERVKERIIEHLAVMRLRQDSSSPILCFVGPPGVGKTSLGKGIAAAMGREFIRISLGGVRDEAEIRGHRRTYVGALPGRIIQGVKKAGSANPVFMLDEIDKLGNDFRGDPSSALLEVLDPEQNSEFSDHYLEVPFDLSRVMFITTANILDPIPPALLDRMEVLRIPGYTRPEKHKIARRFLLPRQLEKNGLLDKQLRLTSGAVDRVVSEYTREAGVRNLEREIGGICRKYARKLVDEEVAADVTTSIGVNDLTDYLGPPREFADELPDEPETGIAVGLAWTAAGGETLQIEATTVPGSGHLVLTGSLGKVMKESARAAVSFVKNHAADLGIDPTPLRELDIHIHVPAGATPKDGPSAGLAIATAISSLLAGKPAALDTAMTGEISLRGRVLPVGGIKEKVLAAARAGVKTVFLPEKNANDLREVPEELRSKLEIVTVSKALPVIRRILGMTGEGG